MSVAELALPRRDRRAWALRGLAVLLSLGLHAAGGRLLTHLPQRPAAEPRWVEMEVVEPPPPEPPTVPPEPEPPRPQARPDPPPEPRPRPEPRPQPEPEPQPEPVPFEETTEAPPPPPRPVRRIQGLSATSFAPGSGTGLRVRAGTTTAVAAGQETMAIEEATGFELVPYASVKTRPRLRFVPEVEVPEEVREAGIEGSWTVLVTVDARGRVIEAHMAAPAGHGIDEACIAAWKAARFRPGRVDGRPVAVTGIPRTCTIRALD